MDNPAPAILPYSYVRSNETEKQVLWPSYSLSLRAWIRQLSAFLCLANETRSFSSTIPLQWDDGSASSPVYVLIPPSGTMDLLVFQSTPTSSGTMDLLVFQSTHPFQRDDGSASSLVYSSLPVGDDGSASSPVYSSLPERRRIRYFSSLLIPSSGRRWIR